MKRLGGWLNRVYYSDGLRKVLVALAVAIVMVSLPTIVWQQYENNKSQDNHHASTVKAQGAAATQGREIKQAEAVIAYEGGVIIYQQGVNKALLMQLETTLTNSHAETQEALDTLTKVTQEFTQNVPQLGAALSTSLHQGQQNLITCIQSQGADCPPA